MRTSNMFFNKISFVFSLVTVFGLTSCTLDKDLVSIPQNVSQLSDKDIINAAVLNAGAASAYGVREKFIKITGATHAQLRTEWNNQKATLLADNNLKKLSTQVLLAGVKLSAPACNVLATNNPGGKRNLMYPGINFGAASQWNNATTNSNVFNAFIQEATGSPATSLDQAELSSLVAALKQGATESTTFTRRVAEVICMTVINRFDVAYKH